MLLEAQERDQYAQSQLKSSQAQLARASSRTVIGNDRPAGDADKDFVHAWAPTAPVAFCGAWRRQSH